MTLRLMRHPPLWHRRVSACVTPASVSCLMIMRPLDCAVASPSPPQLIADRLSDLLEQRGAGRATAVLAAQVALAWCWTAKRLGNNPHTLVDETRGAFDRVLTSD